MSSLNIGQWQVGKYGTSWERRVGGMLLLQVIYNKDTHSYYSYVQGLQYDDTINDGPFNTLQEAQVKAEKDAKRALEATKQEL